MKTSLDQIKGDVPVKISQSTLESIRARRQPGGEDKSSSSASVFSVRYGFRPDSLDENSPFSLSRDKDDYVIEGQNLSSSEPHIFRGQATESKATDYALVYNPTQETFELLPLDTTLRVSRSREKPKKASNGLALPSGGENSTRASKSPSRSISPEKEDRSPSKQPLARVASKSLPKSPAAVPSPPATSSSSNTTTATTNKSASSKKPRKKKEPGASTTGSTTSGGAKKQATKASKRPVAATEPAAARTAEANGDDDDDDVDEDLLGALANELEESLEDDSNSPSGNYTSSAKNASAAQGDESEESDEDEDENIMRIDSDDPRKQNSKFSAIDNGGAGGPISLRGFVSSQRPEEDELSSSEEE